jgi:glycosyltransferase involved in cell wall biosynthesis
MDAKTPSVTVAIVAHKSGRVIGECIKSVLAQDYPREKYDVLVVDDSGDAETIRICTEAGVQYIYAPETDSPGKARNVALGHAKGEVIAFIDTDCVAPRDWLKNIVRDLDENPDVAGVVGAFSGGKNWLQRVVNKEHVSNVRQKGYSTGFLEGNCAFKLSSLDGARFGEHKYAEGIVLAKQLRDKGLMVLTDYDLRVIHNGFTHTLRKFFKMGRAHYHNTHTYFGDAAKSNMFAVGVIVVLGLLLCTPILGSIFAAPSVLVSAGFIYYSHRWHRPVPPKVAVYAYIYFVAARWIFWTGYFVELLAQALKHS